MNIQDFKEVAFNLENQTIAAKIWGNEKGIPVLGLHGWLDNAATFDGIAPLLKDVYLVAIDLPGHGLSSHKSPGHYIQILDYVIDVIELVQEQLNWDSFILMGHSLGGAISSLVAGTIPWRVKKIVILDGLGPMTSPAEHTPMQLRLFLNETLGKKSRSPSYPDIDTVAKARINVNPMKLESARTIVTRGLEHNEDGSYYWRTDPRLLKPSFLHLTEEQALAFLSEITCPMMVVRPEPGFPFPEDVMQRRVKVIKNLLINRLPGQHFVHLDEPEAVAALINDFIS